MDIREELARNPYKEIKGKGLDREIDMALRDGWAKGFVDAVDYLSEQGVGVITNEHGRAYHYDVPTWTIPEVPVKFIPLKEAV